MKNSKLTVSVIGTILCTIIIIVFITAFITEKTTFKGIVTPLAVDKVGYGSNYGYRGIISYIADVGQYVIPGIRDSSGKIIQNGSLLVSMDSNYWKSQVRSAEAAVKSTEAILKTTEENYLRYKVLSKDHSESIKDFQFKRADYYQALGNMEEAQANLYEAQKVLQECHVYSSVEGVISETYMEPGNILAGEPQVLKITQLNPIGVKVELSDIAMEKIFSGTANIRIIDSSGKQFSILDNFYIVDANNITFSVNNNPIYRDSIIENGKKIPVVDTFYSIKLFYIYKTDNSLSVPLKAIHKDEKGKYVWRLNQYAPKSSSLLNVNKIYIIPGDKITLQAETTQVVILKECGRLKLNDFVITTNIDNLKENDKVFATANKYRLMPGSKVSVIIE